MTKVNKELTYLHFALQLSPDTDGLIHCIGVLGFLQWRGLAGRPREGADFELLLLDRVRGHEEKAGMACQSWLRLRRWSFQHAAALVPAASRVG